MMVFADHLGSGDYAMSYAYVVGVLVLACMGAVGAWRSTRPFTRLAAATTAVTLVAVAAEAAASWDEVTGAMDHIAGPAGGEFRMRYVADLLRESTGSLGVVGLLVATAVMWVVASLLSLHFAPKVLALAAALSLITSPVTAVWFLLLGPLVMMLLAMAAAVSRTSLDQGERVLRIGASVGVGLLAGPLLYITLALAQ
jgi:multisubunit Na+/H+ antiporter MnhG subunit